MTHAFLPKRMELVLCLLITLTLSTLCKNFSSDVFSVPLLLIPQKQQFCNILHDIPNSIVNR